jgi:Trk K+ transport system NAD-binding subunit
LDGTTFSDIDLPDGVRGIAVITEDSERLLSDDEVLSAGDCLLFAVERTALDAFRERFDVTGS